MLHIGIATYTKLPDLSADDQLLRRELEARGYLVTPVVWNDESITYSQFDLVVLRSCWDYYLRLPEFLSWVQKLQDQKVRLINPPDTIRWNSSKRYLLELRGKGVLIPKTQSLSHQDLINLPEIISQTGWKKAVLKPLVSAGAYNTFILESPVSQPLPSLAVLSGGILLQEFLPEIQTSGEYSFFYFGGSFSHAVVKRPKSGDFRVQPEHGGITLSMHPSDKLLAQADFILRQVPVNYSYARLDTVERDGNLLLMELELIEPNLFFSTSPGSEKKFADMIESELSIKSISKTEKD